MPSARVQIVRQTGAFNVTFSIVTPGVTWQTQGGWDYPFPGSGDPGRALSFEAWRMGKQSTKLRRLEIDNAGTTLYIETDYGEGSPYELWLAIKSTQPTIDIDVTRVVPDYGYLGDLYINAAASSAVPASSTASPYRANVQLWTAMAERNLTNRPDDDRMRREFDSLAEADLKAFKLALPKQFKMAQTKD